jgi:hypothetical protein
MRRVFLLFVVVTSMLWQTTAVAGPGLLAHGEELAHAMLHWQEEAHHHHDDGSFHQDDSEESILHVALDSAVSAALIWTAPSVKVARFDAPEPPGFSLQQLPEPTLEGLRRPPKLHL